jgi:hypothetical protein
MVSKKEQRSIPPVFGSHHADGALKEALLAPSWVLKQIEAEYRGRQRFAREAGDHHEGSAALRQSHE